jgi:hypothetical protein
MHSTRRRFLVLTGAVLATAGGFLSGLLHAFHPRAVRAQSTWSIRRASSDDLAALRDIFNAQLEAGLFPFTDRIEPWSEEKAAAVLEVYTGTLIVELNGNPAGFAAFVDFTRAGTQSSIIPEADPEVKVLAVAVDRLTYEQRLAATKRLAAATCRDLLRQGFKGCEATIHARTGFQDLFADRLEVKGVNRIDGLPEAKLVHFRIGEILEDLGAEGL